MQAFQSVGSKYGIARPQVDIENLLEEKKKKPGRDGLFWHDYYELLQIKLSTGDKKRITQIFEVDVDGAEIQRVE